MTFMLNGWVSGVWKVPKCVWNSVDGFSHFLDEYPTHCKTHGARKSYPGLATYVRYFVPLWLETIFTFSFYVRYIVFLWFENHTVVIHLCEVCGTPYGWKIILILSIYVRYIVPSGHEFQSHSSSNSKIFIQKMAEPINWISYTFWNLSYPWNPPI